MNYARACPSSKHLINTNWFFLSRKERKWIRTVDSPQLHSSPLLLYIIIILLLRLIIICIVYYYGSSSTSPNWHFFGIAYFVSDWQYNTHNHPYLTWPSVHWLRHPGKLKCSSSNSAECCYYCLYFVPKTFLYPVLHAIASGEAYNTFCKSK